MNMMKLTLGEKFKLLRLEAKKSEREVAKGLKLSLTIYSKLEDDFLYPTDSIIKKTAELYGLTYDAFLEVGE